MKLLLAACKGNVSALAFVCNVSPQAAHMWVKRGSVPLRHVKTLCKAYKLQPADIRPDLGDLMKGTRHGSARKGKAGTR